MEIPKTMSAALLLAAKDEKLSPKQGFYMKNETKRKTTDGMVEFVPTGKIQVCAIGGIYSECVPAKRLPELMTADRDRLVQKICLKIKGSCELLPEKISKNYRLNPDEFNSISVRWIDFVEWLFESRGKTFKQIATILKRYDK
jgi:hypothetical protein